MKIFVLFTLLLFPFSVVLAESSFETPYTFPSLNQELDADLPESMPVGKKSPVWGGVWDENEPSSLESPLSPLFSIEEIETSPKKTLIDDGDETESEKVSNKESVEIDDLLVEENGEIEQKEKNTTAISDELGIEASTLDF